MMKKTLMISISGVRGIIGKGLTPDVISRFSLSFGTFSNGGKVVIGRDTRNSGEMVKHAVVS
ncbi:MAG: phosphoglucosamine mutase, partial [Candidatus Marinimicrobia bacterium]|nr:phosphoglucosamine mutase [Candidatus Neomarinimicrobiota bacterium]